MKAFLTLVLVLVLSTVAVAQNTDNNQKAVTFKTSVVLVTSTPNTALSENLPSVKKQELARLYRYSNSRVKKALMFRTKKDRPKLA